SNKKWYKGNFHAHSQWSDGKDLPEIVVDAYKRKGYDFFSLTDHNVIQKEALRFDGFAMNYAPQDAAPFAGETGFWKRVAATDGWPNLTEEHLAAARARFGADSVREIETAEGKYVRMKTFAELKKQFADEKFLLMPGFEMTAQFAHFNAINVEETFFLEDGDVGKLVAATFKTATDLYAGGAPWLFTVNHPIWPYYNIQPSFLIAQPAIRHCELNNSNQSTGEDIAGAWTPETFLDVVNAHRAARDQPLLYATGTDDSHGIFRKDYLPFIGWTRVWASELTPAALFDAMNRGASYTSSGLEFAEVKFDGKTLSVRLDPQVEGEYKIEFVGTKKDYDPTPVVKKHESPAATVEHYSDAIGATLETVEGLEGSYTLKR
ncbi:MAG: hypothetical protein HUK22_03615, partial [Thermoguttaceae bacterium]|nr:hypothetical protein [Thermoguttaceae bacterium]